MLDRERAGPVVADEKERAAALAGAVAGEGAVLHDPGHADAAQGAAVGAHAAGEGAADDLDGPVLVLAQRPDGGPAQVGTGGIAAVAGEAGVDDRERAAAVEDGPATPAVVDLPGGVAVGEGDVLHGQSGRASCRERV